MTRVSDKEDQVFRLSCVYFDSEKSDGFVSQWFMFEVPTRLVPDSSTDPTILPTGGS